MWVHVCMHLIVLKNESHGNALHAFVYVYIREISVSRAHSLYNLHNIYVFRVNISQILVL
jgi:hypothetical protein